MKIKYLGISVFIMIFVWAFMATSCRNEEWDKHYSETDLGIKSDLNLYDFIKSQENLSTFTKLLQISGYDSILSKSQSYTVWAPDNDALAGIDVNDKTLATKIVKNYVARFLHPTSGVSNIIVPMINNKLLAFNKTTDGFQFNGVQIGEANLATANGIVHVLNGYVPYNFNIWEYISNVDGMDSLRNYINSLTTKELDNDLSFQDGVLVDSIFKTVNMVFDNLASLNIEDSTYTALLPSNTAWTEFYNRIKPYYNMSTTDGGDKMQEYYAKWVLANNLFFRGKLTTPIEKETLTTTSGSLTFYNPNNLFNGTQRQNLSNGYGYVTDYINISDTASWFKPIKMEAEYSSSYGRVLANYEPTTISSLGTGYEVSNKFYLQLNDAALSSLAALYATFPIPYTLSAKYNIYVAFVPMKILDASNTKPNKVKFFLNYLDENGTPTRSYVDSNNSLKPTSTVDGSFSKADINDAKTFITNGESIDKVLVLKDFQLPYSNVIFDFETMTEFANQITFSLTIYNDAKKTGSDKNTYNRSLLIDYIILEPVY